MAKKLTIYITDEHYNMIQEIKKVIEKEIKQKVSESWIIRSCITETYAEIVNTTKQKN